MQFSPLDRASWPLKVKMLPPHWEKCWHVYFNQKLFQSPRHANESPNYQLPSWTLCFTNHGEDFGLHNRQRWSSWSLRAPLALSIQPGQLHRMPQGAENSTCSSAESFQLCRWVPAKEAWEEPGGEQPVRIPSGIRWDMSASWTQHPNSQCVAVTQAVGAQRSLDCPWQNSLFSAWELSKNVPSRAQTMCQGSAWEFVWFFYFPTDGPRLLALQELNLFLPSAVSCSPAHQLSKDSWGLLSPYPCNPLSLHSSFSCSNSVGPQGSNHHQGPVLFITGWSDFLQRWLFPSWPMASLSNLNPFHTSSEKHLGTPTK